jgi:DNA repair exonuclease SbcCD ATPase subunit
MKTAALAATLLGIGLILPACHKKASTPTPRRQLQQAEKSFQAGDSAKAAEAYEAYLHDHPAKKDQDRIRFRLALAYGFPDSPVHNPQRAMEVLKDLIALFPQSPYAPPAKMIMSLYGDLEKLNLDITQRQDQMKLLNSNLEQLKSEVEKLRAEIRERETRLKLLSNELEQLKKIDMERRPARPPR